MNAGTRPRRFSQASIGWRQEMDMEAVYRRCAGLDVHKDVIEVCVLPPAGQSGSPQRRRFATFTSDLIRLRMWLVSLKATEVAMESTGLYWVPVWRQLEGHIGKRLLCNPQQVKALAGRKRMGVWIRVSFHPKRSNSCASCSGCG